MVELSCSDRRANGEMTLKIPGLPDGESGVPDTLTCFGLGTWIQHASFSKILFFCKDSHKLLSKVVTSVLQVLDPTCWCLQPAVQKTPTAYRQPFDHAMM